jgi:hypothetical protein
MAYLRLPVKDFPSIAQFGSGEKVKVVITGSVALKMLGGGDDFVTLEVGESSSEKEEIREHPAEIMKRMLDVQGLVNTPTL